jgi:pilus assembly protein CpaF
VTLDASTAENTDGMAEACAAPGQSASPENAEASAFEQIKARAWARLEGTIDRSQLQSGARRELARLVGDAVSEALAAANTRLDLLAQRDLVTELVNGLLSQAIAPEAPARAVPGAGEVDLAAAKLMVQPLLLERIDVSAASQLERGQLEAQIYDLVAEILVERKQQLNRKEQQALVAMLLDDMLGLGPLEPLLLDSSVNDILVNGPDQVYVERAGKLEMTDVRFRDDAHVLNIATRIVTRIGRRIDETTPLVDARLADGSRVNVIVPPLAIDGPTISIRKFSEKKITLDTMVRQRNISPEIAVLLQIAARCRLNILISGGTGSGKTTLLNAMSQRIDHGERIITIEDAAELQLQQPHVVRLETRTANLESRGEITMRDLLKNALRMRPDRIILGEVRGGEVIDMLQAMNTGHDGSMCTVHANSPREALTRLENMIAMSGVKLSGRAVRTQTAAAINLVVQISRMRDGVRRVVRVVEIVGMEEDVITMQDLLWFETGKNAGAEGGQLGRFESSGLRPYFLPRAEYFGLDKLLLETLSCQAS